MIIENLVRLLLVSLSYIVLIFGLASIMLGKVISSKTYFDKVLLYFISGNFYVINIVYLLLFFKCTSRIITITVLLLGAVAIRYFLDKLNFKKSINNYVNVLVLLTQGAYGWRFFFKKNFTTLWVKAKKISFILFKSHIIETIVFLVCMAANAYYIGYRFVCYYGFGIFDEPGHLERIQMMLRGEIFSDGAYPYGMHNIIYSIIKVFGFKAYTVTRYFGFVIVMFVVIMLFIIMKKVCRSKYTPFIGLFLYVATNIIYSSAWHRLQFTLPMEFGVMFLFPVFIYLNEYIEYRKKKYLILFGISFTLTLYSHPFVTIIALLICLCIFITRLIVIFKYKLFAKIILYGIIFSLIGILPLGIGVITGHELHASFEWAVGVMTGEDGAQNNIEIDDESEIDAIELNEEEEENLPIKLVIEKKITNFLMTKEVYKFLQISMLMVIINAIIRKAFSLKKKATNLQLSILLYVFFLIVLLCSKELGLPEILQDYRVVVFLGPVVPILFCMPIEIIYEIFEDKKNSKRIFNITIVAIIGLLILSVTIDKEYRREFYLFNLLQPQSAEKVFYNIIQEYDEESLTLVSTDYSIILDSGKPGNHTDILFLIDEMEDYYNDTEIKVYNENIFFFIEKTPIEFGDQIFISHNLPKYDETTEEDAKMRITGDEESYFDYEQRKIIMAKANYWAKKYIEYFPNEMTVYFEDEAFICYHLKQDTYYRNNLAIDYGYNVYSEN